MDSRKAVGDTFQDHFKTSGTLFEAAKIGVDELGCILQKLDSKGLSLPELLTIYAACDTGDGCVSLDGFLKWVYTDDVPSVAGAQSAVDGSILQSLPDGGCRMETADGSIIDCTASGLKRQSYQDGTVVVTDPLRKTTTTIRPDGTCTVEPINEIEARDASSNIHVNADVDNTTSQFERLMAGSEDSPVETLQVANGGVRNLYSDGRVVETAADGTVVDVSGARTLQKDPDGTLILIDSATSLHTTITPDGTTVTQYAAGNTTQMHADGTVIAVAVDGTRTEVDPNGVRVVELPGGAKKVNLPDNTVIETSVSGERQQKCPDGTVISQAPDGSREQIQPDGTRIVRRADGSKTTYKATGSVIEVDAAGVKVQRDPDGCVITTLVNGHVIQRTPDGVTIETRPDGTLRQCNTDGSGMKLSVDRKVRKHYDAGALVVTGNSVGYAAVQE